MAAWHNETTYAYLLGGAVQPGDVLRLLERPHSCDDDLQALGDAHGSGVQGTSSDSYFWFRLDATLCEQQCTFSPCFVPQGNYSAAIIPLPNVRIQLHFAPPPPSPQQLPRHDQM